MEQERADTVPGFTMQSENFYLKFITGLQCGVSSRLLEYETDWYEVMEIILSRLQDEQEDKESFEVIAGRDLEYWAKMQSGGNSLNLKIRVMLEEKIYFEPPAEARVQRQVLHPGPVPRPQEGPHAESRGDRGRVSGGPGGGRGDAAAAARGAARPPDPRGAARAALLLDAALLPHQDRARAVPRLLQLPQQGAGLLQLRGAARQPGDRAARPRCGGRGGADTGARSRAGAFHLLRILIHILVILKPFHFCWTKPEQQLKSKKVDQQKIQNWKITGEEKICQD